MIAVLVGPALRRIRPCDRWVVFALTSAGWVIFIGLFVVAALSVSKELTRSFVQSVATFEFVALSSVMLASISIP